MAKPTIYDVAREAGVGIGTVSRVLNNGANVSERSRKRVQDAMLKLGFKPSSAARKLSRRTHVHNIGVITQSFNSYYSFVERLRGVQSVLTEQAQDYELVLYNASSLENVAQQLETIVRDTTVECLLIIDVDLAEEQQEALEQANIPYIGINNSPSALSPRIGVDNVVGGQLATEYLVANGHTRIAYVGDEFVDDQFGFTTSQERFDGYRQTLTAHQIPLTDAYIKLGRHGYESAISLTEELLELPVSDRPTAIFAMSDTQALGCLAALRKANVRVPDELSVLGYDDLEISLHTGLSTVRQHLELSGRKGAEYLLHRLNKLETQVNIELPPPEVIPRLTTRKLG